MKRETALLKNTLIIAFGTILPKFASIITLPILSAKLTKSEYGIYDLILTVVALLLPTITLQIQTACFRFLLDYEIENKEKKVIISTIVIYVGVISTASLCIMFIILNKFSLLLRGLVVLYFGIDMALNVLQQIARGMHNNKIYSLSAMLTSMFNMVFIALIVLIGNRGLSGVLFSTILSTFIAVSVIIYQLKIWKYVKSKYFSLKKLKEMLAYSWPMVPNTLSNWIMNLSDRIVITAALGLEANAVYSIANKIPNLFTSIQGTFVMAWQENASLASKDDDIDKYYSKMFDLVFKIFFSIMAFLIAATPILFKLLINGDYDAAYYQMPILFIALLFSAMASFLGGIYVATKNTKSIGITTMVSAAINLLVNISLIKFIGIYAGSISTLISYFILAIYRMKNVKKMVQVRYKKKNIVVMCLILCLMSCLCFKRSFMFDVGNWLIAIICSCIFNGNIIKSVITQRK